MTWYSVGLKLVAVMVTFVLLAACMAPSESSRAEITCEDIVASYFPPLLDTLKPEETAAWIAKHFDIAESAVDHEESAGGGMEGFGWSGRSRYSSLWFRNGELFQLMVTWQPSGPTGAEVVGCLGPPPFYSASQARLHHGGVNTAFGLFYPQQGVRMVTTLDEETPIHPDISFVILAYTRPGSIEDMMRNSRRSKELPTEADVRALLSSIREWPGSWDAITVDPVPSP